MPVTLRFQSTGAVPGDGAPIVMRGPSLTIGRGQENDIVLPDPDRLISKNHCTIEDQGGGNVIVIDFSTNGTFLNYGKVPLGRVPTPLNDGDVLSMGPYEMVVAITTGRADPLRNLAAPVENEQVSPGRAENAPDLMDLLDGTGARKADFLDDLMGAAEGPRGPSQVIREDPEDELGLDALAGGADPVVGRIADPLDDFVGGSRRYHSPSVADAMSFGGRHKSVIPDDWDDDLLNPNRGRGADPFAGQASIVPPPPAAPRPVPNLPPEAFDDLLPGKPSVPPPARVRPGPEPAPQPTPAAPPAAAAPPPVATPAPRPERPAPVAADEADSPFAGPVPASRMASVIPPPPRSAAPPPQAVPQPAPQPAPRPAAPAAPVGPPGRADAARAFFRGAGQEDIVIPDDQLAATMERLGEVMRTMVEGLRAVLMTRAEIKGEFRVERTQISAGGNNPLKFALSPEHAVEMMLRPRAKGYMEAAVAVREALDDIQAHEVAMVTGIEAAIRELLGRLDPTRISDRAGGSGGIGAMLSNPKAKAWDEYERLYADLKDKAENDFHDVFAKAFSRAYQEQLEKLKQERAQRK
jgi:type VI secretion system FHA domain protein